MRTRPTWRRHYSSDFKGLTHSVRGFVHPQDGIIDFREIWVAA